MKKEMKIHTKPEKDIVSYNNEKYALNALKGTGVAPELVSFDDSSMIIDMELIEIKKADLGAIYNDGDEAIFKYAKAVYGVRKCFIDHGIRYGEWKQCHQFYDEGTGKLVIVDYDVITIFDGNYNLQKELHEKLEKEFSFINSEDYTESSSYKIFKDKLYDASFRE